jgi:effector-binding domain-containing protein
VVEAAVPVDRPLAGTERVKVYGLPESQVAAAVHRGELDSFAQLHATVLSWIETNSYQVVGPYREVYVRGPQDGDASSTEVQYPVAQAG